MSIILNMQELKDSYNTNSHMGFTRTNYSSISNQGMVDANQVRTTNSQIKALKAITYKDMPIDRDSNEIKSPKNVNIFIVNLTNDTPFYKDRYKLVDSKTNDFSYAEGILFDSEDIPIDTFETQDEVISYLSEYHSPYICKFEAV